MLSATLWLSRDGSLIVEVKTEPSLALDWHNEYQVGRTYVILDWDTPCYSLLQLAFAHGHWCTLDLPTANVARIEEAASLCLGISSAQRPEGAEADRPAGKAVCRPYPTRYHMHYKTLLPPFLSSFPSVNVPSSLNGPRSHNLR